MKTLSSFYQDSIGLLTDLYQLTMAYGYWKLNRHNEIAVFHLFFRKNPFNGGYAIACGLEYAIDYLKNLHFSDSDINYLTELEGNDGKKLFSKEFLGYLKTFSFQGDIDAVPEGTIVFAHEPLLRFTGPLIVGQIIETALLNFINFQTLIATKASRICYAAKGDPVLEFGLRRAQGIDGSLTVSRAAYIGGCTATSNVLAGKRFNIPVKGTHAHSWVMSFDGELESFKAYANALPNNCVFLVDTYNTIEGVKNAIQIGYQLEKNGYKFAGIRLDSGDLAFLSIESRKLLDNAGFKDATIVASNDLDEYIIESLKEQGARISVWGVGTKLSTSYDQPALGGVYKLAATKLENQEWSYKIKLSEQPIKISNPGILNIQRYIEHDIFIADIIYDDIIGIGIKPTLVNQLDPTQEKEISSYTNSKQLLVPIFRNDLLVYNQPDINQSRNHSQHQLNSLPNGIKRFKNPQQYTVGLEINLFNRKMEMIKNLRKNHSE